MSAWSKVVMPRSRQPSIQRTRSATLKFQSPMRQAPATMRERVGPPAAVTIVGAWGMSVALAEVLVARLAGLGRRAERGLDRIGVARLRGLGQLDGGVLQALRRGLELVGLRPDL